MEKPPLDLPTIAKALEDAGMEPEEARAAALRVRARASPRPLLKRFASPSESFRSELIQVIEETGRRTDKHIEDAEENILERIEAADRRQTDAVRRHLDAVEYRIAQDLARHRRRIARLALGLFAALAAILAIAAAALGYLD